jgi:hypothetical protein
MALQKQQVPINFIKGLDTKTDPYQLQIGTFSSLQNSVFTTSARLSKRNGFDILTTAPILQTPTLATLNDNLLALESELYAFSEDTNQWLDEGFIRPFNIQTQPLVRVSTSQTAPDAAITANGLTCLAYVDNSVAYYQISDSNTGQQIVSRTALPATAGQPRVFLLKNYFIITFIANITSTPTLQYVPIPIANPSAPLPTATISSTVSSLTAGYDAFSYNNTLFIGWSSTGTSVKIAYLTSSLALSPSTSTTSAPADLMSITVDPVNNIVWQTWWDSGLDDGFTASFNLVLVPLVAKTAIITDTPIAEITSIVQNGILSIFYQNINFYTYGSDNIRTDYISALTVTRLGVVGPTTIIARSVGLASKPAISNGTILFLTAYGDENLTPATNDSNQPSYFLMDSIGRISTRLAYSNGGGYASSQVLPSFVTAGTEMYIPYLVTDFLATVNKGTNLPAGTPVNAIYTQTGINLCIFTTFGNSPTVKQYSSEIANALHLTGGQLWEYDGVRVVEHGFQVWPENILVTPSTTGGAITADTYYYVFTYEWTDNAGNLHRSAPSIPFPVTNTGSTSSNTIYVPTLRLTYKLAPNPVRIVGYRWSVQQQVYYQFTSIQMPVSNTPFTSSTWTDGTNTDTSTTGLDFTTIVDTFPYSSILGQTLLYTTGGVIEDIAAPASVASALFNNRLFLIDAEDPNLLWFSKKVIEAVPVEMSDLLTLFVAPTTGAQGSTGPMTALSAMDDKLIIFKKDAIYYINGNGPDNTGANSTFSDPVFITSTVGCNNPNSVILVPNGVMFQSDKGIWLLGRDLSTQYIGAPVEEFNAIPVASSQTIPGTNQVRFVLTGNSTTLMYDYYFQQWGTHTNVNAVSATLYQSSHTYINTLGQVFQETPGVYLDGDNPILMQFTTAWINVAGIQGYERFYFANLLGTFFTPFSLIVNLAYNYNSSSQQQIQVLPNNYAQNWGNEAQWGSGPKWGGSNGDGNVFSARLFPEKQKCQSFQVSVQEQPALYSTGFPAYGEGLSLSGLMLTVGIKKGSRTQSANQSFG